MAFWSSDTQQNSSLEVNKPGDVAMSHMTHEGVPLTIILNMRHAGANFLIKKKTNNVLRDRLLNRKKPQFTDTNIDNKWRKSKEC